MAQDEWEVAGSSSARVSRNEAAGIALAYVKRNPLETPLLSAPHGPTGRIERVCSYSEVAARRPLIYGMGEAFWNRHWIVYLEQRGLALRSSLIVAVDRETGAVGYAGSANDEG